MLARWTLTNFKSFNSNNEFVLAPLIPRLIDHDRCAQSRSPMDMMRHG